MIQLFTKYEMRRFVRSKNIQGFQLFKRSRDLSHAAWGYILDLQSSTEHNQYV